MKLGMSAWESRVLFYQSRLSQRFAHLDLLFVIADAASHVGLINYGSDHIVHEHDLGVTDEYYNIGLAWSSQVCLPGPLMLSSTSTEASLELPLRLVVASTSDGGLIACGQTYSWASVS